MLLSTMRTPTMRNKLTLEAVDDVLLVHLDDAKANACDFAMLESIDRALDAAQAEARAVALLGRPGVFCGGFDLKVLKGGDADEQRRLVDLGMAVLSRCHVHPQPLVIGVSGHAVALGALFALAGDWRIAAAGEFRIGLNETAIGLALPDAALRVAVDRLQPAYRARAVLFGELYAPEEARAAGYVDEVVAPSRLRDAVLARAQTLAALDPAAYRANKAGLRAVVRSGP